MRSVLIERLVLAAISLVTVLAAPGCGEESEHDLVGNAKSQLEKHDDRSAIVSLKAALQKNPDAVEARYLLGTILLKGGNAVAAEVELRKAHAGKFAADVVVPELARAMLNLDQPKKLVDEFSDRHLDKPAAEADLQTSLAVAYTVLSKPELAEAARIAALAAYPNYAPALLLSARKKLTERNFNDALSLSDSVIQRESGNSNAWKLKGDILLYAMSKPDDALMAYKKSVESDPEFSDGHAAIMAVLIQQGKYDEAALQLAQLKNFAAQSSLANYFEAQLAYHKRDYKLARELSRQLIRQTPKNIRALSLAGAVELQLGAFSQAEIYLIRATQVGPDSTMARRWLVTTYLRSGQPAKALSALAAAWGTEAPDSAMYSLAGEVLFQNGDFAKAEDYFTKALKLGSDDAGRRVALAVTRLAGGKVAEGLNELGAIAASDNGNTADLALINIYLKQRNFDKALVAIEKLEAKQPENPLAATLLGRVQLARKNIPVARESFERALTVAPNYLAAVSALVELDLAENRPNDAVKRFDKILAANPKDGPALHGLAQLKAATGGSKEEVATLLAKAIEVDPKEIAPRLFFINFLLQKRDNKQALAVAQSAVTMEPESPLLLNALGRVHQISGDWNQAIAIYNKLIGLQPLSPQPHVRLAEAYVVSNNGQAAEQSLLRAIALKPDYMEAQRGLVLLYVAEKKYQDAIRVARNIQRQPLGVAEGYELEGDVNRAQRNLAAAAAAYRAGLQKGGTAGLASKLHAILQGGGKVIDADVFATNWIRDHPKDVEFMTYAAEFAISKENFPAAESIYLSLVQIQPENMVALNNLAWVSGRLSRAAAVEYAEKVNRYSPNQPAFMDTLAILLMERNENSRAVEILNKALALEPSNAKMRLNLAKIYIKMADKNRALIELEVLAKLGEKFYLQSEVAALRKSL